MTVTVTVTVMKAIRIRTLNQFCEPFLKMKTTPDELMRYSKTPLLALQLNERKNN